MNLLKKILSSGRDISLIAELDGTTEDAISQLMKSLLSKLDAICNPTRERDDIGIGEKLPRVINFPYARHSSLPELREFTRVFKPRDITPCTFDADLWLEKGWSIGGLFSDCCSGDTFYYDVILNRRAKELAELQRGAGQDPDSQQIASSGTREIIPSGSPVGSPYTSDAPKPTTRSSTPDLVEAQQESGPILFDPVAERQCKLGSDDPYPQGDSQASIISNRAYATRQTAFDTTVANIDGSTWDTIGLISTTDNHTCLDEELGHLNPAQENYRASSADLSAI